MMRDSTRRELHKLRELMHFVLNGAGATPQEEENRSGSYGKYCCFFCKKPLSGVEFEKHGNSIGPRFTEKLSIHHVDGNHDNNEESNKALSHTSCHKSHHRSLANKQRANKSVDPEPFS